MPDYERISPELAYRIMAYRCLQVPPEKMPTEELEKIAREMGEHYRVANECYITIKEMLKNMIPPEDFKKMEEEQDRYEDPY